MSNLPSYVAAAKPVPLANRAAWYKTIAPTYAGVMLWFVFWQAVVSGEGTPGGVLSAGLGPALIGLVLAALICHFLFYVAPGMMGMRTGLPLYIVGTSTYGAQGGLFMPGLLMGLLQFGWLAVNAWATSMLLCKCFELGLVPGTTDAQVPGMAHGIIATAFALVAAFVGLKGIQYVAKVATFLPLIPIVVLLILLAKTCGGLGGFEPAKLVENPTTTSLDTWGVIGVLCAYIVGFFATAGAAGTDIASVGRDAKDVQLGGLGGIILPTIFAGGAAILIVAGAYGSGAITAGGTLNPIDLMKGLMGEKAANVAMIALAISSFPGACFSSLIAANSFRTTMPKINPSISVGIGAVIAALLAVTGVVGKVIWVFQVIGASFGPVCGAMLADYLLSGRKWAGPRAGFNPAGWISWIVGFAVGAFNLVVGWMVPSMPQLAAWQGFVPVPPVAAFVVGFVLYMVLASIGLQSRKLDMPETAK